MHNTIPLKMIYFLNVLYYCVIDERGYLEQIKQYNNPLRLSSELRAATRQAEIIHLQRSQCHRVRTGSNSSREEWTHTPHDVCVSVSVCMCVCILL